MKPKFQLGRFLWKARVKRAWAAVVKAAMSVHSMADVFPFFLIFNIPFEFNALIKPKENIKKTKVV